jgi:HD-GYP domain-containing protein (c-di-GMP phosphodiesterase class II)
VDSRATREWTEEEIQFCSQIANLVSQVFYQETRSQADMIKRLTSVTSSLNRLIPVEKIIPMIGQGALHLSNADKLAIVLREQNGIVRAAWVFGLVKPEIAKVVEKEGDQLLGAFGSTEPVLISKVRDCLLPPLFKRNLSFEGVDSARITPIVHSGNVIGLIAAFDETPMDWSHWEMETMETFANTAALALQSIWLYDQLERGYLDLALSLADTVDARESDIRNASMQLAERCQRTAQLLGLSEEEQNLVRWAALLHDIGKVEVPDEVLRKPGPLSAAERQMIEQYPVKSEKLLNPSSRYQRVGKVLRYIHERFDGKGYPDKKQGEDIPLPSRILAVADAYGSMIDNRPYRRAHSHDDAVQEIMNKSGTQFDPAVVSAFLQTVSSQETIH